MSDYTRRQLLKDLEWQCRAALSVVDDLREAAATSAGEEITPVVRTLVVRLQKVSEILWPGIHRLADRLYAGEGVGLRSRLSVEADSALARERLAPLYTLLDVDLDPVQPDCSRRCVTLHARGSRFEIEPAIEELKRIWGRAADLLL